MPRKIYNPRTKTAFMNAAREARAAGKTWQEAFQAAKAAGYTGSVQGITKMLFPKGAGKRRGRRGPRAVGARMAGRPSNVTASIEALVNRMVKERVQETLDKAIAVLQKAKQQ